MRRVRSCPELSPKPLPRMTVAAKSFPDIAHEFVVSPVVTVAQCHIKHGLPLTTEEQKDFAACIMIPDEKERENGPLFRATESISERLESDDLFRQRFEEWCQRIRRKRRTHASSQPAT
jgi:hypothetical protein